jgi:hypothetical protein
MTLEHWNRALLDVVLPELDESGAPVLLACDDEALRVAAGRIGVLNTDPAALLAVDVTSAYGITRERGVTEALAEAERWRTRRSPRPVPPFLAALCLSVVAASRMDRDERAPTHAYYLRLGDLLAVPLRAEWPRVAAFDAFVGLFDDLALWLRADLGGARGHLALPGRTHRWVVDRPISQTPLRGRDRRLLGSFFQRYERSLGAGFDPLRLLRSWGGIERLTAPARRALADPAIAPQVQSALRAAFAAWDGSVIDADGRRLLPVRLRLGVTLRAVTLNLTCPTLTVPVDAVGPDGPLTLPAAPVEHVLPAEWLTLAAAGPVNLDLPGGTRVRALPGPTMLFEVAAEGMQRVPAAQADPVWLLTCDPDLLARDWAPERRHRAPLAPGWRLIVDVDPSELPDVLRVPDLDEPQQFDTAALLGGLPLGDGAFLLGHPPAVIHDLPEPVSVEIDGGYGGELDPGRLRRLDDIADLPGTHSLRLGDSAEVVFELAARGRRERVGALRHLLGGPTALAAGATDSPPPGTADGPSVCGAVIAGDGEHALPAPVMIRHNATVEVIYTDGRVEAVPPPITPGWQMAVGIEPGERWPIPDSNRAVFLCVLSRAHCRVIALRAAHVPDTDAALTVADEFAGCDVIDRTADGSGARAWQTLVTMAAEAFLDEPEATGV